MSASGLRKQSWVQEVCGIYSQQIETMTPPRTPQVALAFFFAPVAGKRTVFSRSSLLGRLTHQVSHLHGGGEGLVKSYV